jgi:hypothetical protein
VPESYDVPTLPTLTRGPHSPALFHTALQMTTNANTLSCYTDISSGGSACQRVPCSHIKFISVNNPNSVGMGPSRLFLIPPLQTTRNANAFSCYTDISNEGSACQRVSCSHKTVSAVSNPNSVGKVPCR